MCSFHLDQMTICLPPPPPSRFSRNRNRQFVAVCQTGKRTPTAAATAWVANMSGDNVLEQISKELDMSLDDMVPKREKKTKKAPKPAPQSPVSPCFRLSPHGVLSRLAVCFRFSLLAMLPHLSICIRGHPLTCPDCSSCQATEGTDNQTTGEDSCSSQGQAGGAEGNAQAKRAAAEAEPEAEAEEATSRCQGPGAE